MIKAVLLILRASSKMPKPNNCSISFLSILLIALKEKHVLKRTLNTCSVKVLSTSKQQNLKKISSKDFSQVESSKNWASLILLETLIYHHLNPRTPRDPRIQMKKNQKRRPRVKRECQTKTTKTPWTLTMTTSISKQWWCERSHEATPDRNCSNRQFLRHRSLKKVNLWIWIDQY